MTCCCFWHYRFSVAVVRSRWIVLTRAMSLRKPRIFFKLSVCPMLSWNFSLKSWSASSLSWCCSSTSVRLRILSDFINAIPDSVLTYRPFALNQRGAKRQLVRRQPHRFGGILDGYTFHLKQNFSRTH